MDDCTLIRTGVIGSIVAAIGCATPILAIGLAIGPLRVGGEGRLQIPLILLCLGLVAFLYRRRTRRRQANKHQVTVLKAALSTRGSTPDFVGGPRLFRLRHRP